MSDLRRCRSTCYSDLRRSPVILIYVDHLSCLIYVDLSTYDVGTTCYYFASAYGKDTGVIRWLGVCILKGVSGYFLVSFECTMRRWAISTV